MSDNDRFIGRLEDYLDAFDGETPLPMHVRDAIRAELPGTRQDRSGRGPRRLLTMFSGLPTPVRGGLLAAGLIVAVALGATWVNSTGPGVGGEPPASSVPSTAPTPSFAPSPSASASGVVPIAKAASAPCFEGGAVACIAAGTYALNPDTIPGNVIVTVPEGWFPWEPGAGAMTLLVDRTDAPQGSGWGLLISAIGDVRRDPCAPDGAVFEPAEIDTPAEVAAAMATWPGFAVTDPEAITFGDAPGVQVDVSVTEDLGTCMTPATWSTPLGTWIDGYPMVGDDPTSEPATFRILDLDGEMLIIRTPATIGPSPHEAGQGVEPDAERHAEDLIALTAMLDSIRFGEPDAP